MVSHDENKQVLQRGWTDVYHEGDPDNKCYRGKGDKEEVGNNDETRVTLNVSYAHTRLPKK